MTQEPPQQPWRPPAGQPPTAPQYPAAPPPPPDGGHTYGQPPYGQPPQPPQRPSFRHRHPKTFWVLMGLAALFVIGIISSIVNPPKDEPTAASTTSSAPSTSKATSKSSSKATTKAATSAPATTAAKQGPGLGDEVRDGKFAFVVHSVKCGAKSLGDGFAKAQGQFCLVNMTVKNIGDEAQTMFSSNQYAYKGDTKYNVDDTATVAASIGSDDPWIKDINPGNSLRGVIVFDVPKGTDLTKLELHDSAFSGGTEVFL